MARCALRIGPRNRFGNHSRGRRHIGRVGTQGTEGCFLRFNGKGRRFSSPETAALCPRRIFPPSSAGALISAQSRPCDASSLCSATSIRMAGLVDLSPWPKAAPGPFTPGSPRRA